MYAPDPGAFEAVVLGDRMTWYRATLREWINMLDHLKQRQRQVLQETQDGNSPDSTVSAGNGVAIGARSASGVCAPSRRGKGKEKKPKYPDPKGMQSQLSVDGEDLTAWELRFLEVSGDIDAAFTAFRKQGPMNTIGLFVEWLLAVEAETAIADRRREQRALERDAIAFSSSRRLRNRKLPYYPGAIELAAIAMVCQIVVERICMNYAAFCRECTERSHSQTAGTHSISEYFASAEGRGEVLEFFADLKWRGYRLACNEEECLTWMIAHEHLFARTWRLTRDLLAYIFGAAEATIRKDLSLKQLNGLYAELRIDSSLQVHHERTEIVSVAHLYRQGWSQRLVNGRPDPRDEGTQYVLTKKSK